MVFPVFKLAYLAMKQISKPLAAAIKQRAKNSTIFREYFLIPPAQVYHRVETTIKLRLLGLRKSHKVEPLSAELAVDLGAEMLGEIIVFSVAASTIWLEYKRQMRNDQKKETTQNDRLDTLEQKMMESQLILEQQSVQIKELTRLIYSQGKLPKRIFDKNNPNTVIDVSKSN